MRHLFHRLKIRTRPDNLNWPSARLSQIERLVDFRKALRTTLNLVARPRILRMPNHRDCLPFS